MNEAISLRAAGNIKVATFFTHLGGPLWMTVLAAAMTVALTVLWRSRTPPTLMLIAVAGSLAMTSIGKVLVRRDVSYAGRPAAVSNGLFASADALGARAAGSAVLSDGPCW